MIRIGIVEDNRFLSLALQEKLSVFPDVEVVLKASNGKDFLNKFSESDGIALILMDIQMPVMDGIEATQAIKELCPDIKVLMLTILDDDENIFRAIQAGADGYLLKDVHAADLHRGIFETLEGGAAMTPSIATKALRLLKAAAASGQKLSTERFELTAREIEVLELLATGIPNKLIAAELFISVATVGKHIENIYAKLQVHSRLEAVMKARDNTII